MSQGRRHIYCLTLIIRQSNYPDAESFATTNVLWVPSRDDVIAFFRKAGVS